MKPADRGGMTERLICNIQKDRSEYGSKRIPRSYITKLGRSLELTQEGKDALFEELFRSRWMYQNDIFY
jgi:hypothetical protein